MVISGIKVTTIVPENLSKLNLQATYFSQRHFQILIGILQVRTNQISISNDVVILQKTFRKNCNIRLISENALNWFLAVSLKLLNASFLM